jgi:hypothetical protein
MADRSLRLRAHRVDLGVQVGQVLAKLVQPRLRGGSSSFAMPFLDLQPADWWSSVGWESISVRSMAHGSSTRSIALSGRNRSEM